MPQEGQGAPTGAAQHATALTRADRPQPADVWSDDLDEVAASARAKRLALPRRNAALFQEIDAGRLAAGMQAADAASDVALDIGGRAAAAVSCPAPQGRHSAASTSRRLARAGRRLCSRAPSAAAAA